MFTLAHLSDSHTTPVQAPSVRAMLNKRIFGWCKWTFERSKIHRPEVLDALVADLRSLPPDHVAITGDLTNLGFESEFRAAGVWLRQLGDRQFVSLVPGNHDAYVPTPWRRAWAHWQEYLDSDSGDNAPIAPTASFQELTDTYFPSVRIRGPVALVGVCTAQPVGVFRAGGSVGPQQLARLEQILRELAETDSCRVVLIHHPPQYGDWTLRRGLGDSADVCRVLERVGADLVLHGHAHKTMIESVAGPHGAVPVIGVRSASDIGSRLDRIARYHLYRIEREIEKSTSRRFRIILETREYEPGRGTFRYVGEQEL